MFHPQHHMVPQALPAMGQQTEDNRNSNLPKPGAPLDFCALFQVCLVLPHHCTGCINSVLLVLLSQIFHYQSFQYPTTAGTFRDRISWAGDVYKGDASISIRSPTLKDNGTFSCAVKNPPDVHHNIPVTELTITERGKLALPACQYVECPLPLVINPAPITSIGSH